MGDFETIEYLCTGASNAEPNTPGELLEHLALNCVAAQQHRYKISWAADQALDTAYRIPRARILSIACGGSLDIRKVERVLADRGTFVCLNDADPDALSWSCEHFSWIRPNVKCIPGNVFRSISKFTAEAPFDLIIAGGLFDYLSHRQLVWLLPKLVKLLSRDGQLCFTNIASGNPDRVWMEHMASWFMIERSENDIESLIRESQLLDKVSLDVRRDPSAVTLLVKLIKR